MSASPKMIIKKIFVLACMYFLLVLSKLNKIFFRLTIFWSRNNSWQRNATIFEFQLAIIFASSIIIRFEVRPILAISDGLAGFLTFFPRWLKVMKSTDQNVSASKSKIVNGACTYQKYFYSQLVLNLSKNFRLPLCMAVS